MGATSRRLAMPAIDWIDLFVFGSVMVTTAVYANRWNAGGASLAPVGEGGVVQRTVENFTLWAVFYGIMYTLLYCPSTFRTRYLAPYKTNPEYPDARRVLEEVGWSAGSIAVATAWQLAVDLSAERHGVAEEVPVSLWHLPSAVLIYVWADGHFYWQHRLMHYPVLYKLFHKVHHRSKNPNPWSGLSFHPVEAAVYFSPSVVCLVVPWLFTPLMRRALHFGLMLAPCRGHHGYGLPELKADPSHYVHHVKFNYNFGATDYWDMLCGTYHGPSFGDAYLGDAPKERPKAAKSE